MALDLDHHYIFLSHMKYHPIVAALMLYMTYPWEARASGEACGFVPVRMQSGCVRVYVCTYLRRVASEAAPDSIGYSRRVWGQPGQRSFSVFIACRWGR